MSRTSALLVLPLLVTVATAGCEGDDLVRLEGALRVRVINASPEAAFVEVLMVAEDRDDRTAHRTAERPETTVDINAVPTGKWDVYVSTLDGDAGVLQSLQVTKVGIEHDAISEVVVDFAQTGVVRIPCEPGDPAIPLCMICVDGEIEAAEDDARCGVISCDDYSWWSLDGDNSAAGESRCVEGVAQDMDQERCVEPGLCKEASVTTCPIVAEVVERAGLCQTVEGCEAGSPSLVTAPDGAPCGDRMICAAGTCVPVEPDCLPTDQAPLCLACVGEEWVAADDDARCGEIDCSAFETWTLAGDNDAAGSSSCVHGDTAPITSDRCVAASQCVSADAAGCPTSDEDAAEAGLCQTISGCAAGAPVVDTSPDGTPCGSGLICDAGDCVPTSQPPESGCADDEREGFLSLDDYPGIGGCAGAWSVGGVTRPDLQPTCSRQSGDDGVNVEGTGCSAADLCAAGWHVCLGKDEVGLRAPAGCAAAVPPGTPDKALFFAVSQNSTSGSICDQSASGNDVFGCGNLGTQLTTDKGCAPLDRVLASTQANSCGFNEAEPTHGPWMCLGGADSHLMEGSLVAKDGCPQTSCSYDGNPIGNSDKGGVLCCRD